MDGAQSLAHYRAFSEAVCGMLPLLSRVAMLCEETLSVAVLRSAILVLFLAPCSG